MASVGDSVRKSIDEWELGEFEFAMLHACNAVDGTAAKVYPQIRGNNARFTRCLRDNYDVLGPMGMPGIDLVNTRWPVKVDRPKASGSGPDLADVIYGIHRCTHGHGAELPDGFGLNPNAAGPSEFTRIGVQRGKIQLSDRIIFALIAVAVFAPANVGQLVPDGYHLTFATSTLPINDWWGRIDDARALMATVKLPSVKMDFADWMTVTQQ
jgi:hypothetical protein